MLFMDLCASVLFAVSSWINYAPWWVLDILSIGTLLETCTGLYLCSYSKKFQESQFCSLIEHEPYNACR